MVDGGCNMSRSSMLLLISFVLIVSVMCLAFVR